MRLAMLLSNLVSDIPDPLHLVSEILDRHSRLSAFALSAYEAPI
jgi:hypothetical protein